MHSHGHRQRHACSNLWFIRGAPRRSQYQQMKAHPPVGSAAKSLPAPPCSNPSVTVHLQPQLHRSLSARVKLRKHALLMRKYALLMQICPSKYALLMRRFGWATVCQGMKQHGCWSCRSFLSNMAIMPSMTSRTCRKLRMMLCFWVLMSQRRTPSWMNREWVELWGTPDVRGQSPWELCAKAKAIRNCNAKP